MKDISLTTKSEFAAITKAVFAASTADDVFIGFNDEVKMTTRFANNQIIQNIVTRRPQLSIKVSFGEKVGWHRGDKFDSESLHAAVLQAEKIATVAPEDPQHMPSLGALHHKKHPRFSEATAQIEPQDFAEKVSAVVEKCKSAGVNGAGIFFASKTHVGVASNKGLFAFEALTSSSFSLTATLADSTGWAMNSHRNFGSLAVKSGTQRAIEKANISRKPQEIEAGEYQVILEPAAVAGLLAPVFWSLSAKDYHKGNSPYVGKLGKKIFDDNIQIRSAPEDDDLLGAAFDWEGMPFEETIWIENGVLKNLLYDRFTAKEQGKKPLPYPSALKMSYSGTKAKDLQGLISNTNRGILVTNFWYIRYVSESDLSLTGMTRDGTFLIEDGKIVSGVKNLRWHDSPLRTLANISAATEPMEAVNDEYGKMLLPCLKLPSFRFTSSTRF